VTKVKCIDNILITTAELTPHLKSVKKCPSYGVHFLKKGLTNTVHLLGTFPLAAMPDFYALADIMLITLKNDYIFSLTVPAKIQSYLVCSKPILAMMNGEGARVVIESKAGLACNSGDFR